MQFAKGPINSVTCKTVKSWKADLMSYILLFWYLLPALLQPPSDSQGPKTVFYINRHPVCMSNRIIFWCFLLRIIHFTPAHSFTPNILSQEVFVFLFFSWEGIIMSSSCIHLYGSIFSCYFESHGAVGLVVKRGLAWFYPELENT